MNMKIELFIGWLFAIAGGIILREIYGCVMELFKDKKTFTCFCGLKTPSWLLLENHMINKHNLKTTNNKKNNKR